MGKRKRRTDPNKTPPPDAMQQSSRKEASWEQGVWGCGGSRGGGEADGGGFILRTYSALLSYFSHKFLKSSDQVESSAMGPISPILEIMDDSVKLPQVSQSPAHHQHFSRGMPLRNPRYCSRKYYRRNSANHADASTSHGKATSSIDENLFFKLATRYRSDDCRERIESLDQAFRKPERIRSSSFGTDAVSHDTGKIFCGICQRLLRKKAYLSGGIGSSSELSVVAVLVCGHVYHADCLEERTCQEARTDPPCPTCVSLISHAEA